MALETAVTQQLLGMARADMARARKANDKIHMIAGVKGGGCVDIRYKDRNLYEIVKLSGMSVDGEFEPGAVLYTGNGVGTAAFIVDEVYDVSMAD